MTKHASLGASSAHRWMHCPGSVNLASTLPDTDTGSVYAQEGTAAHSLAERCLRRGTEPETYSGMTIEGVTVSVEMVDAVSVFVDEVWRVLAKDVEAVMFIEQRVDLSPFDPPARMFGTADAIVYLPTERKLVVMDLKHGRGVVVEARDNPQLRYYGLGALLLAEREKLGPVDEIELVVVQPRAHHEDGTIRSETLSYLSLVGWAGKLLTAARATQAEDAPLVPGPTQCRWCPAKAVCPALHSQAQALTQVAFSEMPTARPPEPETLPREVLLDVLNNAKLLEDWIASVKGFAFRLIEEGAELPGWKLVDKRAMRKWKDAEEAREALLLDGSLAYDDVVETKTRSVAQVEAVMRRTKNKVPTELYEKKSSGKTLVPSSDKRPAARPALSAFYEEEK